jgi:TusA-related sulfurtransferase
MAAVEKIMLDARELEHPIPLERAMHSLRELNEHNYFYMIHRKNPVPLIDLASEQGFNVLNREDDSGVWHIFISKPGGPDILKLCHV